MPPITSSRAGTRVTQISPAVKKLAKPVGSLLGFCRSCSNSEISNGSSDFIVSPIARRDDVGKNYSAGHAGNGDAAEFLQSLVATSSGLPQDCFGANPSRGRCRHFHPTPFDGY